MGAKKDPKKDSKTPAKNPKKKEGGGGGKAKKKKWSKGKSRDKLNNLVLFDKNTYDKLYKEVPTYKLITPSIVSERLKVKEIFYVLKLHDDQIPTLFDCNENIPNILNSSLPNFQQNYLCLISEIFSCSGARITGEESVVRDGRQGSDQAGVLPQFSAHLHQDGQGY